MVKRKFTLLELLIVIAIIGILMTLLLPNLQKTRKIAQLAVCLSNQSQISKMVMVYTNNNNQRVPPYKATSTDIIKWGFDTRFFYFGTNFSSRKNLAYLWDTEEQIVTSNTSMLFCPSQSVPLFQAKSYAPFPLASSGEETLGNRIRIGYNYNPWRIENNNSVGNSAKYNILSQFDTETIITGCVYTQAANFINKGKNSLAHSDLNSVPIGKGDGSAIAKSLKK